VQPGVGAHQRGPALVFDRAADGDARGRQRVTLGRDQVLLIALIRPNGSAYGRLGAW
jgi:hypothetical protein